jgi:hypothetical protein
MAPGAVKIWMIVGKLDCGCSTLSTRSLVMSPKGDQVSDCRLEMQKSREAFSSKYVATRVLQVSTQESLDK